MHCIRRVGCAVQNREESDTRCKRIWARGVAVALRQPSEEDDLRPQQSPRFVVGKDGRVRSFDVSDRLPVIQRDAHGGRHALPRLFRRLRNALARADDEEVRAQVCGKHLRRHHGPQRGHLVIVVLRLALLIHAAGVEVVVVIFVVVFVTKPFVLIGAQLRVHFLQAVVVKVAGLPIVEDPMRGCQSRAAVEATRELYRRQRNAFRDALHRALPLRGGEALLVDCLLGLAPHPPQERDGRPSVRGGDIDRFRALLRGRRWLAVVRRGCAPQHGALAQVDDKGALVGAATRITRKWPVDEDDEALLRRRPFGVRVRRIGAVVVHAGAAVDEAAAAEAEAHGDAHDKGGRDGLGRLARVEHVIKAVQPHLAHHHGAPLALSRVGHRGVFHRAVDADAQRRRDSGLLSPRELLRLARGRAVEDGGGGGVDDAACRTEHHVHDGFEDRPEVGA
mmetsp:Transcript_51677/g.159269  ORF Transcript_51677/g.159269 Transcript_51677/m.159269 type:complete len:449 (+) Transcript_51677:155-1501(+)